VHEIVLGIDVPENDWWHDPLPPRAASRNFHARREGCQRASETRGRVPRRAVLEGAGKSLRHAEPLHLLSLLHAGRDRGRKIEGGERGEGAPSLGAEAIRRLARAEHPSPGNRLDRFEPNRGNERCVTGPRLEGRQAFDERSGGGHPPPRSPQLVEVGGGTSHRAAWSSNDPPV